MRQRRHDSPASDSHGQQIGARCYEQEPVNYEYLEAHLDELDLSPSYYESMEEQHHRQGAEMLRFKTFSCNLDATRSSLSQRERFRLFLKEEGRHNKEQRRRYLLFLKHDQQHNQGKPGA